MLKKAPGAAAATDLKAAGEIFYSNWEIKGDRMKNSGLFCIPRGSVIARDLCEAISFWQGKIASSQKQLLAMTLRTGLRR